MLQDNRSGTSNYRDYDGTMTDNDWVNLARDSYRTSSDYFDSSLRRQWERNQDLFRNRHPAGSRYNSEAYKKRSHNFRPKTRAVIRKNEAAAAIGFFSTNDGAAVSAMDESNPQQVMSAAINQELVNYRLQNSIPWFLTCVGAYQDAMVSGLVISKQTWRYATLERPTVMPLVDEQGNLQFDENGKMQFRKVMTKDVIEDQPDIQLIPPENLRIHPAANWVDPINTSPFVIHLEPMFAQDVIDATQNPDSKVPWKPVTKEMLRTSHSQDMYYDSIRRRREGTERVDSKEVDTPVQDFDVVWRHENMIRWRGRDWVYYTMGTELLISEPIPREELYLHAYETRPFVAGYSQIEAHRPFPSGIPELVEGLQVSANDLENQRRDNVNLVLNKRYYMRRGARIDTRSLTRNVPGSITQMEDINTDIRTESTPDVTQSAYAEQDRLNADFDELVGNFSAGSVSTSRSPDEPLGVSKMLNQGASEMTEYQLRVFSETWAEPVIGQVVKMEQAYETDQKILKIAGEKANIQAYNVQRVEDYMIQGDFSATVGVGFGSTDPEKRIKRLAMGMEVVGTYFPQVVQQADPQEFVKEVFGALGYKDGTRIFPQLRDQQPDPRIQELEQQVAEMGQIIEQKQIENQTKIQVEEMRQEGEDKDRQAELQIAAGKLGEQANEKIIDSQARVKANQETQKTKILTNAQQIMHDARKFNRELALKEKEGMQANEGLE